MTRFEDVNRAYVLGRAKWYQRRQAARRAGMVVGAVVLLLGVTLVQLDTRNESRIATSEEVAEDTRAGSAEESQAEAAPAPVMSDGVSSDEADNPVDNDESDDATSDDRDEDNGTAVVVAGDATENPAAPETDVDDGAVRPTPGQTSDAVADEFSQGSDEFGPGLKAELNDDADAITPSAGDESDDGDAEGAEGDFEVVAVSFDINGGPRSWDVDAGIRINRLSGCGTPSLQAATGALLDQRVVVESSLSCGAQTFDVVAVLGRFGAGAHVLLVDGVPYPFDLGQAQSDGDLLDAELVTFDVGDVTGEPGEATVRAVASVLVPDDCALVAAEPADGAWDLAATRDGNGWCGGPLTQVDVAVDVGQFEVGEHTVRIGGKDWPFDVVDDRPPYEVWVTTYPALGLDVVNFRPRVADLCLVRVQRSWPSAFTVVEDPSQWSSEQTLLRDSSYDELYPPVDPATCPSESQSYWLAVTPSGAGARVVIDGVEHQWTTPSYAVTSRSVDYGQQVARTDGVGGPQNIEQDFVQLAGSVRAVGSVASSCWEASLAPYGEDLGASFIGLTGRIFPEPQDCTTDDATFAVSYTEPGIRWLSTPGGIDTYLVDWVPVTLPSDPYERVPAQESVFESRAVPISGDRFRIEVDERITRTVPCSFIGWSNDGSTLVEISVPGDPAPELCPQGLEDVVLPHPASRIEVGPGEWTLSIAGTDWIVIVDEAGETTLTPVS